MFAAMASALFGLGFVTHGALTGEEAAVVSAANAADAQGRCSLRTLKGTYGVRFDGTKLGLGVVADKMFASVSLITFDGRGKFTTDEIGRFGGDQIKRTFTGPYKVSADCSGFLDFSSTLSNPPHEAHGVFVIVDQGQGLFFLDDEDAWAAGGVGRKL